MSKERLIFSLNYDSTRFQNSFKRLKPDIIKEARRALGDLALIDLDNPPARLHLHALTGKTVVSVLDPSKKVKVYTIHLTTNDAYKASFTFENGTAYMRYCGAHDEIDGNP